MEGKGYCVIASGEGVKGIKVGLRLKGIKRERDVEII